MCFHASRFGARKNEKGELILYHDQDESLWDQELISKGAYFLHKASQGNMISKYHIEAGIAYWHTVKSDTLEKWQNILLLYDQLLSIAYSPIAALNRTYALAKIKGNAVAIAEAEKLNLTSNHFYFTLLGELYSETDVTKARMNFDKALSMAKTSTDKLSIGKKLRELAAKE
jgi:RNA polymerase sigma-70 factor (ECF subfamily)